MLPAGLACQLLVPLLLEAPLLLLLSRPPNSWRAQHSQVGVRAPSDPSSLPSSWLLLLLAALVLVLLSLPLV